MNRQEILELFEEVIEHCEMCDNDGLTDEIISHEQAIELRSFLESVK